MPSKPITAEKYNELKRMQALTKIVVKDNQLLPCVNGCGRKRWYVHKKCRKCHREERKAKLTRPGSWWD